MKMRKFRKNIVTPILLVVFTFSSVGFSITSLCCDEIENEQISTISESCCAELKEPSCCEEEVPKKTHNCNHGCDGACFSTQEYSKLEVDQISIKKKLFKTEISCITLDLDNEIKTTNSATTLLNVNKSPPKLWGRSLILSLNKPKLPAPFSV